jgi:hypothetical protein
MTTNEIKRVEGELLNNFLDSIPRCDRKYFIYKVINKCGYPVTYKTFNNWRYMACRIPIFAKRVIEEVAERQIFIWEEPYIS